MNNDFMQLAIKEAWKYQFLTYPNPAVGAVVVKDGEILSVEAHKVAGAPHAEVLALKEAYLTKYPNSLLKDFNSSYRIHEFLILNHNNFFRDCEIYVTLEPCNHTGKTPACAMLLESVGIKKVYIGTLDPNKEASGGLQRLQDAGIIVETGICKEQTDRLLEPFRIWQEKNFIFFKIAMREDGSVDGGYITTQDSLDIVHSIRTKLDLLVIGGETVRVDRPTLDTRFAKVQNPPNILIYSRQKGFQGNKAFDKTIKLFHVKNREVFIEDSLKKLDENKFIMVEGGYRLLDQLKYTIDYLVVFVSHKEKQQKLFDIESLGFKKIYSYMINEYDEMVFLK
jgi:diaminohydroxyphosphoribosylaminopyrimidine deaminase / 5-amino-6-(5-phosphoribosylamino)uracil reductase